MRYRYYVNTTPQANGDHEVHKEGCSRMPEAGNRIYLGDFGGCRTAIIAARAFFQQSNGCYDCSQECHAD